MITSPDNSVPSPPWGMLLICSWLNMNAESTDHLFLRLASLSLIGCAVKKWKSTLVRTPDTKSFSADLLGCWSHWAEYVFFAMNLGGPPLPSAPHHTFWLLVCPKPLLLPFLQCVFQWVVLAQMVSSQVSPDQLKSKGMSSACWGIFCTAFFFIGNPCSCVCSFIVCLSSSTQMYSREQGSDCICLLLA